MLVLMGIKHCGKSTVGRLIAKRRNVPFFDLDDELEYEFSPDRKFSFREIYKKEGKSGFHGLEVKALKRIAGLGMDNPVLSLGGGTVENTDAMNIVERLGLSVYLKEDEEVLFERIIRTGIPPFLEGDDPASVFHSLYERRNSLYLSKADVIIQLDGRNPEDAAEYTETQIDKYLRSR